MAFVDELIVSVKAGRGGNGVVRWLHLKGKEFSGPAGGDGGRGGSVYAKAARDVGTPSRYNGTKLFAAENGGSGESGSKHGKNGDDCVIAVPVGSVITNLRTKESFELLEEGERHLLSEGGRGGYGNEHFKGSKNVTPKESTPGEPGEKGRFRIELRLIADAGLIGLPNAGKTSLLNELTNAKAKVGSYAFTTLDPNLGTFYGYVLADIPGLIEGASSGKGLGDKFLRHIRRTKILLHCISLEEEDRIRAYKAVRRELGAYDKALLEKPEVIVLTKSDTVGAGDIKNDIKDMKKYSKNVLYVSIIDDPALKQFTERLSALLSGKA